MKVKNFEIIVAIINAIFLFLVNAPPKKSILFLRKWNKEENVTKRFNTKKYIKAGGPFALTNSGTGEPNYDPKKYHQDYDAKMYVLENKLRDRDLKSLKQCITEVIKSQDIIEVDKAHVFEQTYSALRNLSVKQLLNYEVHLKGDEQEYNHWKEQDWYSALMIDIFNHQQGLFDSTQNGLGSLINPLSSKKKDYENLFRFVGKMLALGYHRTLLLRKVQLGRILLKTILKRKIYLIDVEAADPEFYRELMNVQKDPKKHSFTLNGVPHKYNGVKIIRGKDTSVEDYRMLAIEHKYVTSVSKQIKALSDGFNALIPLELLHYFKASDLEILLYGGYVNLNDWRNKTDIVADPGNPYADATVDKFWRIMRGWNDDRRMTLKLLYFITGTTQTEKLEGKLFEIFVDLDKDGKPISNNKREKNLLPSTNITARRLYLPFYSTVDELSKKLIKAINNSEPFR